MFLLRSKQKLAKHLNTFKVLVFSFRSLRIGHLAQNTIQVFTWNIARLVTQLAWAVLLARVLGPEAYGGFSGIAGLAISISGIAGIGLGLKMYQDVARDLKLFEYRWAQAVQALRFSTAPLALGFVILGTLTFPQMPLSLLTAVALSELAFAPVITLIAFGYASHGCMARAAAAPVALSLGRLVAVSVYAFIPWKLDLVIYAWMHLTGTILSVALTWVLFRHEYKISRKTHSIGWRDIREGLGFASIWASGLALGSLDKTISLRQGGEIVAGHYTAAQRFASVLTLPIDALVTAVMPRLFQLKRTEKDYPDVLTLLLIITIGYGCAAGFIFWWCANLVPLLIGSQFRPAVPAMQALAFYIPVYGLRSLGANVLLGCGMKRWRFLCEIIALIIMATLMILLISLNGAIGAAYAVLISEIILVFLIWSQIIHRPNLLVAEPQ